MTLVYSFEVFVDPDTDDPNPHAFVPSGIIAHSFDEAVARYEKDWVDEGYTIEELPGFVVVRH